MKYGPVIFGEVLYDCFPDGTMVLGGAPFNVAWHLQAFGCTPVFVSSVGTDAAGEKIIKAMDNWGMGTQWIERDPLHPTGRVNVTFVSNEPTYDIVRDSAWDHIHGDNLDSLFHNDTQTRLLYNGSLALRSPDPLHAYQKLIKSNRVTNFLDINLRAPWYTKALAIDLFQNASMAKLNEEELTELHDEFFTEKSKGENTISTMAREFIHRFSLALLLITRGSKGAILYTKDTRTYEIQPKAKTEVVDTVGAGDGFTSIMLLGQLKGWDLDVSLERAQSFASEIIALRGATTSDRNFYENFARQWSL